MEPQPVSVVLAIDDSASSLMVLEDALNEAGYHAMRASDGMKGLAMAMATPPDLILLDVIMPGIDGFETCRRFKSDPTLRDIPLIFMTSLSTEQFKLDGFEAGAVDYLTKPLQMREMLARVQTHLSLSMMRRRLAAQNLALQREMAARASASRALLSEAEGMAALGRTVATMAHDINAPVGMALTAASVLESRLRMLKGMLGQNKLTRSEMDKFIADGMEVSASVTINCRRAADLVRRLRSGVGERASAQRHRFLLGETVRQTIASMHPHFAEHHITWDLKVAQEVEMDSYPGILVRVLTNLAANAQDHAFAADGGRLDLSIEPGGEGRVLLRFADNGCGAAAVDLPRIFDAFYTTRREQGNSGLGMHIVRTMVNDILGGAVAVASEPGKGFVVTLDLPLCAPPLADGRE